ncbi:MAG TPA: hypothetical protein VKX40_04300 [Aequorivita sp.]|nr:hypothetical protein [Aequorivita sp.]
MSKVNIKLKSRKEVADNTMEFHLTKPQGFTFKPGQFADYTEINPSETDTEGDTRGFSLGAPYEEDIIFTTRMRDTAFKRNLKKMPIGTEVVLMELMDLSPFTTTLKSQPSFFPGVSVSLQFAV